MADFAAAAFLNVPNPTLIICDRLIVHSVNRAAQQFFHRQVQGEGAIECKHPALSNNQIGTHVSDFGIEIVDTPGWNDILQRAQEREKKRQLLDTIGPDNLIALARLPPDEEISFLSHRSHGVISANFCISCWEYSGHTFYTLMFYRRRGPGNVTSPSRSRASSNVLETSGSSELSSLRAALFESHTEIGLLLTADERTCYLNRTAADTMAGGHRTVSIQWLEENFCLWDPDYQNRIPCSERPFVSVARKRADLPPQEYGYITRDGKRMQLMVRAHRDGYRDWFSKQWSEYTGMPTSQCLGWGWKKSIHPEDYEQFGKIFEEAHATGMEYEAEVRIKRYDGVWQWTLKRGTPLKDASGNVIRWYGTNTVIHDSVIARLRAKRERDQMVRVMHHAQINIWAVSKETRSFTMVEGNSLFTPPGADDVDPPMHVDKLLSQVLGSITFDEADMERLIKLIDDVMDGHIPYGEMEITVYGRHFRFRIVADIQTHPFNEVKNGEIVGILGCAIDISDMKARLALEIENAALQTSQRLAEEQNMQKSKFLANMSHEIRTPVSGVIGMADLLLDSSLTGDQRLHAEAVQVSAQNLLMIVNDILDFSRIEAGQLQIEHIEFSLATLVKNLCMVLKYGADQKGITFTHEVSFDQDLHLIGDPGRIRQVLSNLLSNAIKFTMEGSVTLSVSTALDEEEGKCLVTFVVGDTGIGIPPEVLSKLFQPYKQGDSSTARLYGGTGLGLSISLNLTNLMNGNIYLESEEGVGTKAFVKLPLPRASAVARGRFLGPRIAGPFSTYSRPSYNQSSSFPTGGRTPTHLPKRSRSTEESQSLPEDPMSDIDLVDRLSMAKRSNIHVLLAEDNAINQLIAVRSVEKLGFTVTAVWNGKEVLDYLAAPVNDDHPKPAVILMDCQMPVLDGYGATRKLRNEEPYINNSEIQSLPVIALTASAIQGDREKCFDAGMSDYLSKPVQAEALERMLVKWIIRGDDCD